MASVLKVDKLDPQSGTALEIGTSGDTITIPSGATIVNSGTATGFGSSAFASETFGARMDTLRTFTSGSDNTLVFETELWDSDTAYNTTTGKYTVPTAGSYLFGGMVKFHETASTFTSCTLYFNVAGVQQQVAQWYDSGGGDVSQLILNFSVPNPSLSVSDDVYMQASATTLDSSTYNCPSSAYTTVFWGARIA